MPQIVDIGASHGLVFVLSFDLMFGWLACLLPAWLEASVAHRNNLLLPINPKQ
jgi:hypothetical protein